MGTFKISIRCVLPQLIFWLATIANLSFFLAAVQASNPGDRFQPRHSSHFVRQMHTLPRSRFRGAAGRITLGSRTRCQNRSFRTHACCARPSRAKRTLPADHQHRYRRYACPRRNRAKHYQPKKSICFAAGSPKVRNGCPPGLTCRQKNCLFQNEQIQFSLPQRKRAKPKWLEKRATFPEIGSITLCKLVWSRNTSSFPRQPIIQRSFAESASI